MPGLANRNGLWDHKAGSTKRGGICVKKFGHGCSPWLYPLAAQVLSEKLHKIINDFTNDGVSDYDTSSPMPIMTKY